MTISNYIDNIDMIVYTTDVVVLESLIGVYNKALMIMDNYHGDNLDSFDILQESFIMESNEDKSSKQTKKKNIIKRMIDAVLKLISKIKNFFKKKFGRKHKQADDEELSSSVPNTSNNINNINDNDYTIDSNNCKDLFEFSDKIIHNLEKHYGDLSNMPHIYYRHDGDDDVKHYTGKEKTIDEYYLHKLEDTMNNLNKIVDSTDNSTEKDRNIISHIQNIVEAISSIIIRFENILRSLSGFEAEETSAKTTNNQLLQFKTSRFSFTYRPNRTTTNKLPKDIEDKLFELGLTMRTTKSYNEYHQAHIELCRMIDMPSNHIIEAGSLSKVSLKQKDFFHVHVVSRPEDERLVSLKEGTKLYHTSSVGGLTELRPTFRASSDADSMYPTQRVYFYRDRPGSRTGVGQINFKLYEGEHVYEYDGNVTFLKCKSDTEASGSAYRKALYIETDSALPVKDVTDQFK